MLHRGLCRVAVYFTPPQSPCGAEKLSRSCGGGHSQSRGISGLHVHVTHSLQSPRQIAAKRPITKMCLEASLGEVEGHGEFQNIPYALRLPTLLRSSFEIPKRNLRGFPKHASRSAWGVPHWMHTDTTEDWPGRCALLDLAVAEEAGNIHVSNPALPQPGGPLSRKGRGPLPVSTFRISTTRAHKKSTRQVNQTSCNPRLSL